MKWPNTNPEELLAAISLAMASPVLFAAVILAFTIRCPALLSARRTPFEGCRCWVCASQGSAKTGCAFATASYAYRLYQSGDVRADVWGRPLEEV
eukprot:9540760-Karenia_brevis.AAC.1